MNTKRQSAARVKQNRAIELRATGMRVEDVKDQINREFGTTHSYEYVKKMLSKALRENPPEGVDELRNLETYRLDKMLTRLTADFMRPTPALVQTTNDNGDQVYLSIDFEREDQIMRTRATIAAAMLKVQDRRAKLFGLDALPPEAAPVDVLVNFSPEVVPVPMTDAVVDVPRDGEE